MGLSRTSSIELSNYLGRTRLSEADVLQSLDSREWEALDLPALVKREINRVLEQKRLEASGAVGLEKT